jgi:hypothetical protein
MTTADRYLEVKNLDSLQLRHKDTYLLFDTPKTLKLTQKDTSREGTVTCAQPALDQPRL